MLRSALTAICCLALLACSGDAPALEPTVAPTDTRVPPPTLTPVPPTATHIPEPTQTPAPRISRPPGEVDLGNTARVEMSLTFDCGASGLPTPAILDALKAAGVRTTFFITGQWASTYPELFRRIAAEHEVANHSWSHPDFRELSDAQILVEMQRAEEAFNRIAGVVSTRPLWRAPFGSRDRRILGVLQGAGWSYHIFWSADSGDWLEISPEEVRGRVSRAARNGALIVQHCGSPQTASILPAILSDLQGRGFRLVTVTELLRD